MINMQHFKGWDFKGITETYISGQKGSSVTGIRQSSANFRRLELI